MPGTLPVGLIRRFPADRRRGKAGVGYSANLKRNSKVLDFVKRGGVHPASGIDWEV